jgi:hypothetical protein
MKAMVTLTGTPFFFQVDGASGRIVQARQITRTSPLEIVREKRISSGMWRRSDIRFVLGPGLSQGGIATMRIETPGGDLLVMGEPGQDLAGKILHVRGVHTNGRAGSPLRANAIGLADLHVIAQAFLAEFDYEHLILEGAVRTSGRRKGARPRAVRFTRHPEPASKA